MGVKARDTPSVETPDEFKSGAGIGLADKILRAKEEAREKEIGKGKGNGKSLKESNKR
jgi:hypothetical protein